MRTPRRQQLQSMGGGFYGHRPLRQTLNNLQVEQGTLVNLQLCVDGVPLSKSSSIGWWVIFGWIVGSLSEPFLIGCWEGKGKPKIQDFMEQTKREIHDLQSNGFREPGDFTIHSIVADSPAKTYVLGYESPGAKNGCPRCTIEGKRFNAITYYPRKRPPPRLRTHED